MPKYDILFNKENEDELNEFINSYFLDDSTESATFFPNFNQINIIVGANNSGKSRFMRFLMSFDRLEGVKNLHETKELFEYYNINVNESNREIERQYQNYKNISDNTFYAGGINSDKQIMEAFDSNRLSKLSDYNSAKFYIEDNKKRIQKLKRYGMSSIFIEEYNKISDDNYKLYEKIKRYYIPTLRTAHSIFSDENVKIEKDIFLETLNKYYNLNDLNVEVFTGIHLYKDILNTRNSRRDIRKQFENFEAFISKNFFNSKKVDIVAEFNKDKSLININESEIISVHIEGENETRKLYELGDGVQAIIILMYKIFMAEPNSFIFIDEPELNLHPGMQRLFLEQICNNSDLKKKELTYVISTHSNHFLDLIIEKENVSIYSFSPKLTENEDKQFIIKNVNAGDNQLLKSLGVNNSSVFMANCSIWVEGISDRNYIKAFLKSYSEYLYKSDRKNYVNLKEDIDYAFFEYAGSNIDHYIFEKEIEKEDEVIILKDINSLALNNRIFLLADSDSVELKDKKRNRLKSLEDLKSENFFPKIIWEVREIENLITNDIWKEILIEFCNKTLLKKHRDEIQKKIEDALLLVDSKKYSKKYVGEFIEKVREKVGIISKSYVVNQSTYEVKSETEFGTIINKRELSELVFEKNFSWEILSKNKQIENLTVEIYNFILKR